MKEQNIKVSVKYELQDFQSFLKLVSKTTYIILNEVYGLFILLGIIHIVLYQEYFIFSLMMICWIGNEIWFRVYPKRLFKDKTLSKERTFYFSEENVENVTVDGSSKVVIRWDELYKVKKSKDIYILMTGKISGLIIPKRCIDNEQVKELEELIINKLGDKAFSKKKNPLVYIIPLAPVLVFLSMVIYAIMDFCIKR